MHNDTWRLECYADTAHVWALQCNDDAVSDAGGEHVVEWSRWINLQEAKLSLG